MDRDRLRGATKPAGWGHGEAELPFGSFGLEEGPVPILGKG